MGSGSAPEMDNENIMRFKVLTVVQMRCALHVDWCVSTSVSEGLAAYIFRVVQEK